MLCWTPLNLNLHFSLLRSLPSYFSRCFFLLLLLHYTIAPSSIMRFTVVVLLLLSLGFFFLSPLSFCFHSALIFLSPPVIGQQRSSRLKTFRNLTSNHDLRRKYCWHGNGKLTRKHKLYEINVFIVYKNSGELK